MFVFHLPRFSVFLPHSMWKSVCVSFSTLYIFLTIFHVLQCVCHIFHILHFSSHIRGPTVCISHFSRYSLFLAISTSYSVCFPFCSFSVFLAIFQVLPCEFLIFHLFQCFSSYSRSKCIFSHFPHFSVFSP